MILRMGRRASALRSFWAVGLVAMFGLSGCKTFDELMAAPVTPPAFLPPVAPVGAAPVGVDVFAATQAARTPQFAPIPARVAAAARAQPVAAGPCKTVKLLDATRPRLVGNVPAELRAYLGHWGPTKWDGKLCHELVIEEIREDGTARVADLQGFYMPWNRWPTAFRRDAYFEESGTLVVDQGRLGVSRYVLQDGVLHATYDYGIATAYAALPRLR